LGSIWSLEDECCEEREREHDFEWWWLRERQVMNFESCFFRCSLFFVAAVCPRFRETLLDGINFALYQILVQL